MDYYITPGRQRREALYHSIHTWNLQRLAVDRVAATRHNLVMGSQPLSEILQIDTKIAFGVLSKQCNEYG